MDPQATWRDLLDAWFEHDWARLQDKKYLPPFKPSLSSENFDPEFAKDSLGPLLVDSSFRPAKDSPFANFSELPPEPFSPSSSRTASFDCTHDCIKEERTDWKHLDFKGGALLEAKPRLEQCVRNSGDDHQSSRRLSGEWEDTTN